MITALKSGDLQPIRVSWSLSHVFLREDDWPARYERLRRGISPWLVFADSKILPAVHRVFADAVAGLVSLDFAEETGRVHIYAIVLMPRSVTPQLLDDRWMAATGTREQNSQLVDRVTTLGPLRIDGRAIQGAQTRWEKMVRVEAGQCDDEELHSLLIRDVEIVVDYCLKGSDAQRDDRRLPKTLPRPMQERPASDWIVWGRGITWPVWGALDEDGFAVDPNDYEMADLGDVIDARYPNAKALLMPANSTAHCPFCWGCKQPVRSSLIAITETGAS